jgi:hypothetical protein
MAVLVCLAAATTGPPRALVPPDRPFSLTNKEYRHPDLFVPPAYRRLIELPPEAAAPATQALAELGVGVEGARLDVRSGRWGTLLATQPILPGDGTGNHLRWEDQGQARPRNPAGIEKAAREAFIDFLTERQSTLRISPAELSPESRVVTHDNGELIQVYAPRTIAGIPVRSSYLTAVISHGNLVLFGAHNWGDLDISTRPSLSLQGALTISQEYFHPLVTSGYWSKSELILVPMARGQQPDRIAVGNGYEHRLAWQIRPRFEEDPGHWEILVDAHRGEVLAFEDTNQYATTREVKGGVYPVSNDGTSPDGLEQAGWPMPFDRVTNAGAQLITNSGGNLPICVDGTITSSLDGKLVGVSDTCGPISLPSTGDIDFGTSGGTDCTTPGLGGSGNTHSARTSFYELNRIKEQARGQLPANPWLQEQLTANVNITSSCNAFWNGATVNFYRSGGGCANTGELAGVIDHEWGHGMDDNDANPMISNPGEGIADIYAYLRLDTSCIGRGFEPGSNCGGFGDPCTICDGVRDIDYAKRQSGQPHDVNWIDAACGNGNSTPCRGSTHCEGAVYAEAVYDLVNRDLAVTMDHNTALELGTRLTYFGAAAVGDWFQCVTPYGGCNADGGYLNYLAADDDNGNLNDGTPHMSAIFAAFDRHGIACDSPTVQDSGCPGTPATAPSVSASPLDRGASLSWSPVAGTTKYQIFRTDGVAGCDFGKVKIGETSGTSFTDSGLQNGRPYYYVVIPIGAADTCMGPASSCTAVTPVSGSNLAIDRDSTSLWTIVGDGDDSLDNCEAVTISFDIANIGSGTQTNIRIVSATSVSHPSVAIGNALVSPSTLGECGVGLGSFDVEAAGLAFDDTVEFEVEVTSDELSPSLVSASLFVRFAESDYQNLASKTFTFEADAEGWKVVQGTFSRASIGGGGQGTTFYEASSADLADQCDQIRSPVLRLSSTSTLEVFTQFDIEGLCSFPFCSPPQWFDRANVGLFEAGNGERTPVGPDGGRSYNAGGINGTCGTGGQDGWAGSASAWASSGWSASALGSSAFAGRPVQLDIRYGTDESVEGSGFHFDEVTLTDFELQVPDTQSDSCAPQCAQDVDCDNGLFCDGTEICVAGICQTGTPVDCNDGVSCTDDACNEGTDSCDNTPNDDNCDNGLFCDGNETCDAVNDCQTGTAIDCNR